MIVAHLLKLIEHVKDNNVGFATWLLEQQTLIEELEHLDVPLPETLQVGVLLMHIRYDDRYDRIRELISESQWSLNECTRRLQVHANDIGDTQNKT